MKKEGSFLILKCFLFTVVITLYVPHQFDTEAKQLVLNVFDSQLCSPSEENL